MGELERSSYIEQQRPAARGSALCIRPEAAAVEAAAVVEAAEERAVGRQCATATGRQLAVTALLLTPHRATQIELGAEPLVARVRSETQSARAREWGEHLHVARVKVG